MRPWAALVLVVGLALAGCGADSERIDPSGVDELVIPTPSPDPDDFVETIDNPFLPLTPGNTWRYDATFGTPTPWTVTVTIEPDKVEIAGVATTAVQSLYVSDPPGAPPFTIDYYAQDAEGNVWWFGHEGDPGLWMAGVDGAEAGLAMPAHPRLGDGWRRGYQQGVVEDRLTVTTLDGDKLVLRQESALEPGVATELTYARGYGLISSVGPDESSELSAGP